MSARPNWRCSPAAQKLLEGLAHEFAGETIDSVIDDLIVFQQVSTGPDADKRMGVFIKAMLPKCEVCGVDVLDDHTVEVRTSRTLCDGCQRQDDLEHSHQMAGAFR
jgi:NMD protein affecting ribosome stability and mRNA decay